MASDSMGTLIKLGLVAGAGYLVYEWFFATPSTTAASTAVSTTGAVVPVAAPTSAYNSLANLLSRIQALASAQNIGTTATQSPDQWNYFYTQAGGPQPAPAPEDVFGGHAPITLAQYWAGMSQWLATNKGLTGLGVYAGLGRLAYARRR